jgi:hypothetical protein
VKRSLGLDRISRLIAEADGDRVQLKRLRRQVRTDPTLTDSERAELLEQARYHAGCKPVPLTLDEHGNTRPMTSKELMADRWASETEGGVQLISAEEAEGATLDPGPLVPPQR